MLILCADLLPFTSGIIPLLAASFCLFTSFSLLVINSCVRSELQSSISLVGHGGDQGNVTQGHVFHWAHCVTAYQLEVQEVPKLVHFGESVVNSECLSVQVSS